MSSTLTAQTYEMRKPDGSHDCWVTRISDTITGMLVATQYFKTETEGRQWGNDYLNGTIVWNTGGDITLPTPSHAGGKIYTIKNNPFNQYDPLAPDEPVIIRSLDEAPSMMYGDFSPPKPEPKPLVPVKCYHCGTDLKAEHSWDHWSDDLTLTMSHCGKLEVKRFTLTQAKELAKVGWMAFLS